MLHPDLTSPIPSWLERWPDGVDVTGVTLTIHAYDIPEIDHLQQIAKHLMEDCFIWLHSVAAVTGGAGSYGLIECYVPISPEMVSAANNASRSVTQVVAGLLDTALADICGATENRLPAEPCDSRRITLEGVQRSIERHIIDQRKRLARMHLSEVVRQIKTACEHGGNHPEVLQMAWYEALRNNPSKVLADLRLLLGQHLHDADFHNTLLSGAHPN